MPTVLLIRYAYAALVLAALVFVAWKLISVLTTPDTNEGLAALLGALITALGQGFTGVVRDLYNPGDEQNAGGRR